MATTRDAKFDQTSQRCPAQIIGTNHTSFELNYREEAHKIQGVASRNKTVLNTVITAPCL